MKVLLADDSMTIRMILKNLLNELGIMDITEGSNGQEALELLTQSQFELILTDIHMPKIDGLMVLEEVKTNPESTHKYVPVVIISSDTDYRQIERARKLGAFGYIKKPFKRESLQAAIKAAQEAEARRQSEEALNSVTHAAEQINQAAAISSPSRESTELEPVTVPPAAVQEETRPRSEMLSSEAVPSPPRLKSSTPRKGGLLGWIRRIFGKN